jgi:arylsulfatase
MANSRATWPLGRGFDRWYGFHGGETHQFVPALYHDNHAVRPPRAVADGYHLSADLADRAIEFLGDLRAVDDELPFFLYFATGACHSPHHAPAAWIERYEGRFARGWDAWREETFARQLAMGVVPEGTVLTPRPPWVPSWESLDERQRVLAQRFMECFAAFLSYTDEQVGRVLAFVEDLGDADDTVVIIVSDNGASSEGGKEGTINEGRLSNFEGAGVGEMYERIDEIGGPLSHNNYPWGWTMAGNTPFKRWKREVHEGGVADPCIVRLPAARRAAAGGGLRRQYAHAIDITPTLLELVGLAPPTEIDGIAQTHLDGTSFAHLLGEGGEDEAGRHRTQHFEMLGSRAIYHDGWKAVTYHPVGPIYDDGLRSNAPWDDDVWELYHVAEDVSESRDRAAEFPEKVAELVALWWEEARRNDVLPLDNRVLDVIAHKHDHRRLQSTYRYFQDGAPVPEWVAVDTRNRSHDIALTIEVPDDAEPSGTLLALGCALGGWSLHVIGGRLRYLHNLHGQRLYEVAAASELGPGRHEVVFRFEKDDFLGGRATLLQDGTAVGSGEVKRFTPVAFNELMIGLTCGYEWGPAVGGDYEAPFAFNGTIVRAEVTATGPVVRDPVAEVAAILASQ